MGRAIRVFLGIAAALFLTASLLSLGAIAQDEEVQPATSPEGAATAEPAPAEAGAEAVSQPETLTVIEPLYNPEDVDKYISMLNDEKETVREEAAEALAEIADPKSAPALIEALKDEDPLVRESATYGLGDIGDKSAITPLIEVLSDEDPFVREGAAYALGILGTDEALKALEAQSATEKELAVQDALKEAVSKIKGETTAAPAAQ